MSVGVRLRPLSRVIHCSALLNKNKEIVYTPSASFYRSFRPISISRIIDMRQGYVYYNSVSDLTWVTLPASCRVQNPMRVFIILVIAVCFG